MYTEVNNIALVLGVVQSLFLAALLVHRHRSLYANRFLAALMLVYGIVLTQLLLQDLGVFAMFPRMYLLVSGLPLATAPLHYLYARHLVHPDKRLARSELLHFVPYVVYKLSELPLLTGGAGSIAALLAQSDTLDIPPRFLVFNWSIIAQSVVYMTATLVVLRRHTAGLEDLASSIEHLRLRWLRNITLITQLAWLLFAVEFIFYLRGILFGPHFGVTGICGGILVYVLGYMGLSRSEILEAKSMHASMLELSRFREKLAKYAKSGLALDRAEEAAARLISLMEVDRVYADSGLTLPQLAEFVGLTPHNLSEVINTRFHQNFFDFVNTHRIRQVQTDLRDPAKQHLTILALAFDAGFNSKTSFNAIFKKHAGVTPSEYRAG